MQSIHYLKHDKVFSWINIGGLAIGLTAVMFITFYIWQETHYDDFHHDEENLYRVSIEYIREGNSLGGGHEFVDPLAPAMKAEIPEIEAATRISSARPFSVTFDDKSLIIDQVCFADVGFLEMFNFPLLQGDFRTALTGPYSIVISDKLAEKMYGKDNPIGKVIRADGTNLFTITGVVKSPPANTQFQFDALVSFSTLYHLSNVWMGWNGGNQYTALVRLNNHASLEAVTEKTNRVLWENIGVHYASHGMEMTGSLQAIRDVHLHYNSGSETLRTNLTIFAVVGLLILFVAGINFVNLTAARSLRRIKETWVRKLYGAKRGGLMKMFMSESLLVSILAFVLAVVLFKLFEPLYVRVSGTIIGETSFSSGLIVGGLFALAVLIGVIAGSYPAFRLSLLPLGNSTKGVGETQKREKHAMQNVLVVLQFAISVGLIVCTLVVSRQLSLINTKDTGMDRSHIINVFMTGSSVREREPLLKERLNNLPGVVAVTASSEAPIRDFSGNGYLPEGMETVMMIKMLNTDEFFLDVYGIKLKEGRFFRDGDADRSTYVINEALARTLGWGDNAVGKYISRDGRHEVIGVVHDFNYASLYHEIEPLIIANRANEHLFNVISIKYNTSDVNALTGRIRETWTEIIPDSPFEYSLLHELYNDIYKSERQFRLLFFCFAFIAIVLAVSGMLSLMAYTIKQRKKEIGIRKVYGASILDVLRLLLQRTAVQVIIANIIAVPVAWWFTNNWLENFAFRIHIGWTIFALAFLISSFIALIAVSFQAIKAATENPLDAIQK